jgi:cob(I)alamin adenosyltransferase
VTAVSDINPIIQRYLNRLSDHLFVLARVLNSDSVPETLWVPGAV